MPLSIELFSPRRQECFLGILCALARQKINDYEKNYEWV